MIKVKRVYEPASPEDGARYLVDRLWPRGMNKEALKLEAWVKEAAPSNELRRWYGHEPERWEEFQQRYFAELALAAAAVETLLAAAQKGTVTLLFSSRELERNNAAALKIYLEGRLARRTAAHA